MIDHDITNRGLSHGLGRSRGAAVLARRHVAGGGNGSGAALAHHLPGNFGKPDRGCDYVLCLLHGHYSLEKFCCLGIFDLTPALVCLAHKIVGVRGDVQKKGTTKGRLDVLQLGCNTGCANF